MAELLTCIECGKSVSSEAHICPHCKTKHYKGVECNICGEILKQSDAKFDSYIGEHNTSYTYYHKSCYQTRQDLKKNADNLKSNQKVYGNCPLCKTPYIKVCDGNYYLSCSNCGQFITVNYENPFDECRFCSNKLLKQDSLLLAIGNKKFYSHPVCYNKKQQLWVKQSNERYEIEQAKEKLEKQKRERKNKNDVYWNGSGREDTGAGCFIVFVSIILLCFGFGGNPICLIIGILGIISTIYHLIE